MSESPGNPRLPMMGVQIKSDAVGPFLGTPEIREALRQDLDRGIEKINQRIAEGGRVTKLDYVVYVDGEGFSIFVDIEDPAG